MTRGGKSTFNTLRASKLAGNDGVVYMQGERGACFRRSETSGDASAIFTQRIRTADWQIKQISYRHSPSARGIFDRSLSEQFSAIGLTRFHVRV